MTITVRFDTVDSERLGLVFAEIVEITSQLLHAKTEREVAYQGAVRAAALADEKGAIVKGLEARLREANDTYISLLKGEVPAMFAIDDVVEPEPEPTPEKEEPQGEEEPPTWPWAGVYPPPSWSV